MLLSTKVNVFHVVDMVIFGPMSPDLPVGDDLKMLKERFLAILN